MKKLGTSMIALAVAGTMFVTASVEANGKTRSSIEQGQQRRAHVAFVANSKPQQEPMHPEAKFDFGDADSYDNAHPDGGG